jgi:hypothetical protein
MNRNRQCERKINLYAHYRKWRIENLNEKNGVVVGSDLTQEWLLPWWWEHYSAFHSYPVAFVDFGMSEEMKKWCRDRGELIPLYVADIFVAEKQEIEPFLVEQMENVCGKGFWPSRPAWFKKPLACLQSPFRKSIWIDLDCQIRGPLNELFELCEQCLAIAKDGSQPDCSPVTYNSGVIVFKHGIPVIETWADQSFDRNREFRGDQDVLSAIIHEQNVKITEIPAIYNWSRCREPNPHALILHWHGPQGKGTIAHQIMKMNLESL